MAAVWATCMITTAPWQVLSVLVRDDFDVDVQRDEGTTAMKARFDTGEACLERAPMSYFDVDMAPNGTVAQSSITEGAAN